MNRLLGAAVAVLAVTAPPQEVDQAAQPFRAEVGVYRLQVRLVDADGNYLSGVSPQDLQLLVDNQPRSIVDLMEIDAATLEPAGRFDAAETVRDKQGGGISVTPRPHLGSTPTGARRRFMIFFDVSSGRVPSRNARTAASDFVGDIALPGDLIGLTIYTAHRGLEYVVPFTSDRRMVQEAIRGLAIGPTSADQRGLEGVATLQDLVANERLAAEQGQDAGGTLLVEQLQRIQTSISAASLSDALQDMSDALADLQGRKQILLFSAGFPNAAMWDTSVREALIAVASSARRAGVVFHTFHPGTLAVAVSNVHDLRSISSSWRPPAERPRGPLYDAPYGRNSFTSGNDRDALYYLSGETGGTATFFQHTLHDGLEEVERRTRRYYTLAFPVYEADSEQVRIEIRALTPGVHVEWAPSQLSLKSPAGDPVGRQFQVANALEADNDVAGMDLTAVVFPLGVVRGFGRFAVIIEVPRVQLATLLQSRDDDRLSFEIMGLAISPNGTIADSFRGQIQLTDASAKLSDSDAPLRYQNVLALAPGEFVIKLLLRERAVGQLTSRTFTAVVPADASRGLGASKPLAVVADHGSSVVQGAGLGRTTDHRQDLPRGNPFIVNGRVLSPRVGLVTVTDEPINVFLMVQNFTAHPFNGQPSLSVESWIEAKGGSHYRLGTAILGVEQPRVELDARLLLRLSPLQAVPPGSYTLVLRITDRISGSSVQSSTNIAVRSQR